MSGNKFLLDTNAILYMLGGDITLSEFLYEKQLYISIITEMELLSYKNITIKEQKIITSFLKELIVININDDIKVNTIELKKKFHLQLPDCIIAGTSLWLKIPLITSDKQFKTISMKNIINTLSDAMEQDPKDFILSIVVLTIMFGFTIASIIIFN